MVSGKTDPNRGFRVSLAVKIILKGKGSKPGETTRIPAIYPVEASINNNVLCLDFFSKVPSVTVSVINLDTNETVYLNTFINPVSLITLDLNLVEGTAYRLELLSKDYDLSGDFELYEKNIYTILFVSRAYYYRLV